MTTLSVPPSLLRLLCHILAAQMPVCPIVSTPSCHAHLARALPARPTCSAKHAWGGAWRAAPAHACTHPFWLAQISAQQPLTSVFSPAWHPPAPSTCSARLVWGGARCAAQGAAAVCRRGWAGRRDRQPGWRRRRGHHQPHHRLSLQVSLHARAACKWACTRALLGNLRLCSAACIQGQPRGNFQPPPYDSHIELVKSHRRRYGGRLPGAAAAIKKGAGLHHGGKGPWGFAWHHQGHRHCIAVGLLGHGAHLGWGTAQRLLRASLAGLSAWPMCATRD